uniref:Uncharacterized protein n=1 Tax=Inoviridae sp. ctNqM18 TaxID=2825780 RepID=A0A8S5U208_9VIRU|nr:MAG TPA: hypothetical protein [Inoviridae sp. ctNqM18]
MCLAITLYMIYRAPIEFSDLPLFLLLMFCAALITGVNLFLSGYNPFTLNRRAKK